MSTRGPRDTGSRLRRLLAIIPWVAARGTATLEEIGARFGLSVEQVEQELLLAACCGLPPYSPDQLIDLVVDEGGVTADVPDYFKRPPRLAAADGFALLAAGRALLAVPGSDPKGPLASAMAKLGAALGAGEGLAIELDAPHHLEALRAAAADHRSVDIDYYSASRDEETARRIDPLSVFADRGHWYVAAYCHRAEGVLTFRVDRVNTLQETGEHFADRHAGVARPGVFIPGPDTPEATIEVPRTAAWVPDVYPVLDVEERRGGRLRIRLAISGRAWLERLVLRIGPTVKVVAPGDLRDVPSEVARRVLRAYR